ncbi:UNKNOWN [Stylonychia lemnae]|uniref:Uncharacterized protein n=1 Tax=Stylonychia lemnae TaxID=5949 RepID=A0A078B450_STYLE|nr:UNKNOWN [Stylonychia lemnae]|eukprot:CDW87977.1 UNKNOWN [Stylonychia lemnae]
MINSTYTEALKPIKTILGTLYHPQVFGGSIADCNQDIFINGFDSDNDGNVILTGLVDNTAARTSCKIYSNGNVGSYSFITYINFQGDVKWQQILASNPGKNVVEPKISFDKFLPLSSDTITESKLRADSTNQDVFLMMQLQSSYFGDNSFITGMLLRLDSNLNLKWWKKMIGLSDNKNYLPLNFVISDQKIWGVNKIYLDSTNYKFSMNKIDKANGQYENQCLFMNTDLGSTQLFVDSEISQNQSTWGITFFERYYFLDHIISDVRLGFSSDGNAIVSAIYNTLKGQQQMGIQGMKYDLKIFRQFSKAIGTFIVITLNSVNVSTVSSSSDFLTISPTDVIGQTIDTVTTFSLVTSIATATDLYTLYDNNTNSFCNIPYQISPSRMVYNITSSALNPSVSLRFKIQISNCKGQVYSIDAIKRSNGAELPTGFSFASASSEFLALITTANYQQYTGTRHYMIEANLKGQVIKPLIPLVVQPHKDFVRDVSEQKHDSATCGDSIYPFFYGQDYEMQGIQMTSDQYNNIMIAGQAAKKPFGAEDSFIRGFLSLIDQRGVPFWIYSVESQNIGSTQQAACYHISYQNSSSLPFSVFGLCSSKSYYFQNLNQVSVIIKLLHSTGEMIYQKILPSDNTNPIIVRQFLAQQFDAGKVVVAYQYTMNSLTNFAVLNFNELDFSVNYFKFYSPDNPYTASFLLIDAANNLIYQFKQSGSSFMEQVRMISTTSGQLLKQVTLDQGPSQKQAFASFYGTNQLLVPFIEYSSTPVTLHAYILNRFDLTTNKSFAIVLTSQYSHQCIASTTDSQNNIYLTTAKNHHLFIKINSDLTQPVFRIWKGDSTRDLSTRINLITIQDAPFYMFVGKYTIASDQISTLIFKDTKLYNCFDMSDIQPNDTVYYPASFTIFNKDSVEVINPIQEIDAYLPTDNFPILPDGNVRLFSYSYSAIQKERLDIGEGQMSNKFKAYPFSDVNCGMISPPKTFNGQSIYEFIRADKTETIKLNSTVINCQDRPNQISVLNPIDDSTTYKQTFVSYDTTTNLISLTLNASMKPQSFYMKIRYTDIESTTYFYDHYIMIKIVDSTNLTLSKSNPEYCNQNVFPMSYGNTQTYGELYSQGFWVNTTDNNLIIGGSSNASNPFIENEDLIDGYVMRVSSTGYVEWLTQINQQRQVSEIISAVTASQGYVYAHLLSDGDTEAT